MNPLVKGSIKSKINWLGLAVIMLSYLQTNLSSFKVILAPVVKPEILEAVMGVLGMVLGLSIITARFFTTESLAEKGGS